jgi:hypothetical protein
MWLLLSAIGIGLIVGLMIARWLGEPYRVPDLHHLWLAGLAFLPQFFAFYFPPTRASIPNQISSYLLIASLIFFLIFVWLNRRQVGMLVLAIGLLLNFAVISVNGGYMPISSRTASQLIPPNIMQTIQPGDRFGTKDILLSPEETRLEWLSDRFLTPDWFPYRTSFSLGDLFVAVGAGSLLSITNIAQRRKSHAQSANITHNAPSATS